MSSDGGVKFTGTMKIMHNSKKAFADVLIVSLDSDSKSVVSGYLKKDLRIIRLVDLKR